MVSPTEISIQLKKMLMEFLFHLLKIQIYLGLILTMTGPNVDANSSSILDPTAAPASTPADEPTLKFDLISDSYSNLDFNLKLKLIRIRIEIKFKFGFRIVVLDWFVCINFYKINNRK